MNQIGFKGTLMEIWKSANIFDFIWKESLSEKCIRTEYEKIRTKNNSVFGHFSRSEYVEDFKLKHLLLSEIFAGEICEKIV